MAEEREPLTVTIRKLSDNKCKPDPDPFHAKTGEEVKFVFDDNTVSGVQIKFHSPPGSPFEREPVEVGTKMKVKTKQQPESQIYEYDIFWRNGDGSVGDGAGSGDVQHTRG